MPLAENRFDVAPQDIKDEQIAKEMPRVGIEQHRGDKLPRVSILNAVLTERQVILDEPGLECVEKKLGDETGNVQRD